MQDHTHTSAGVINGSGILNTSADGDHTHNWGGNWGNDDSRDYTTGAGNGDGTTNTMTIMLFTGAEIRELPVTLTPSLPRVLLLLTAIITTPVQLRARLLITTTPGFHTMIT